MSTYMLGTVFCAQTEIHTEVKNEVQTSDRLLKFSIIDVLEETAIEKGLAGYPINC